MGIALFAGVIAENIIPASIFMGQAKLPILMSIMVYYALNRPIELMLISAMAGGILCDSLNALPLGYSSLCFCAVGVVVRMYREVVFSRKWLTHILFGAVTGTGYALAMYILLVLSEASIREAPFSWIVVKALGTGVFGMVLVPIVFVVMERLDMMMGNIVVKNSE